MDSLSTPISFCLLHASAVHSLSLVSCVSLFAITVERYISVVYPLRYPLLVTVRRSKIVTLLLWIFLCVFLLLDNTLPGSWFNVVIYYIRNERFRTTAKQIFSNFKIKYFDECQYSVKRMH
ncbi:uncharacterized protein [Amphiura filiformis]|uniref:uncharacterized protein n=1 Tax=Amphiura filiformis TaxID=82378 RepID=UPI003B2112C0